MGTVMSMTVVGVRGSRIVQAHDPGITEVRLAIEDGTPTWPLNIFFVSLDDGWHVVSNDQILHRLKHRDDGEIQELDRLLAEFKRLGDVSE